MRRGIALLFLAAACEGPSVPTAPWLTALTRDQHAVFPINSGSHGGVDCNECHGAFDTFTRFSCTRSCHPEADTDPIHASVPRYTYSDTSCYDCHPNSEPNGLDHSKIFPIAPGDLHGAVACRDCHIDPTNRSVLGCGDCHPSAQMQPAHGSVGGYAFDMLLCIRCHGDSQVDRVAAHLPFAISSGRKHYLKECLTCHPAFRADKAFAADFALPATTCGPCHGQSEMNDKHQSMPSYSYQAASCIQAGCHPTGSGGG